MDAPADSVFSGPTTLLFLTLCVLKKSFHGPGPKRKSSVRVSSFALFTVVFKWHHSSEGVNRTSLQSPEMEIFAHFLHCQAGLHLPSVSPVNDNSQKTSCPHSACCSCTLRTCSVLETAAVDEHSPVKVTCTVM